MATPKAKGLDKGHQRVVDSIKMKQSLKNNKFWDDCNRHYEIATQAIHDVEGQLAEQLSVIVETPELASLIKDPQQLSDNITLLNKDINDHVSRLNAVRENHKDKTGGIKSPEEGIEVIQINGKYQEVMEIYNANIVPVICHILEQIAPAQEVMTQALQSVQGQHELLDVNVVSDVQVKEV